MILTRCSASSSETLDSPEDGVVQGGENPWRVTRRFPRSPSENKGEDDAAAGEATSRCRKATQRHRQGKQIAEKKAAKAAEKAAKAAAAARDHIRRARTAPATGGYNIDLLPTRRSASAPVPLAPSAWGTPFPSLLGVPHASARGGHGRGAQSSARSPRTTETPGCGTSTKPMDPCLPPHLRSRHR